MAGVNQGPKAQGTSTKDGRRPPPLDPHGLIGNPVIVAVRGRVGDVVYKTYGAKIIITRVPCFDGYVPTAAQRARRDRMREATTYAKRIYADPAAKAVYVAAAKTLHRQPFRLAISDCLKGCSRIATTADALATALPARPPRPYAGPVIGRHFHLRWARYPGACSGLVEETGRQEASVPRRRSWLGRWINRRSRERTDWKPGVRRSGTKVVSADAEGESSDNHLAASAGSSRPIRAEFGGSAEG